MTLTPGGLKFQLCPRLGYPLGIKPSSLAIPPVPAPFFSSHRPSSGVCSPRHSSGGEMVDRSSNRSETANSEMVQGTLDMLILRTLVTGPAHGHTIAHVIERTSENVLEVEQGSLY